jgi:hypothetical protein
MSTQSWSATRGDPNPMDVTCDLETATSRDVRRRVRELLPGQAGVVVDDAALVADELVSNALGHATAPRVCRLGLVDQGRCLRIEVDDGSSELPRMRTPDRHGGRGLVLVDRLSSAWGVDHYGRGKTVWAELVVDHSAGSGHARHLAPARHWPQA